LDHSCLTKLFSNILGMSVVHCSLEVMPQHRNRVDVRTLTVALQKAYFHLLLILRQTYPENTFSFHKLPKQQLPKFTPKNPNCFKCSNSGIPIHTINSHLFIVVKLRPPHSQHKFPNFPTVSHLILVQQGHYTSITRTALLQTHALPKTAALSGYISTHSIV
jgi:hypothetical protein